VTYLEKKLLIISSLKMKFALKLLFLFAIIALNSAASRDRNNKKYKVVCYWAPGLSIGLAMDSFYRKTQILTFALI